MDADYTIKPAQRSTADVTDKDSQSTQAIAAISQLDTSLCELLPDHFDVIQVNPQDTFSDTQIVLIDLRPSGNQASAKHVEALQHYHGIVLCLVDAATSVDFTELSLSARVELFTASEFGTPVLELRVRNALHNQHQQQQYNNTDSINLQTTDVLPVSFTGHQASVALQALMSYSTDWMVIKDRQNRFLMVSPAFAKLVNLPIADILGKNDLEIGTPPSLVLGDTTIDAQGFWDNDQQVMDSGEHMVTTQSVFTNDDSMDIVERVDRVPLVDQDGNTFALLVSITEAHKFNSRLSGDNASWISRTKLSSTPILRVLDEEHQQLQQLRMAAEAAYEQKNRFLASASHDIRQPLHALGMFISSLERELTSHQQHALLSKIRQSSRALNNIIDSLLDIARLDAKAVVVERSHFTLGPIIDSVMAEQQDLAKEHGARLVCDIDDWVVYTDNLLLQRVLRNLLTNAIKFTGVGIVTISTESFEQTLNIVVSDTGPGIPADKLESIFDEYIQLNNPERDRRKGIGFGLAVVKRLTDLLGIDLSVESNPEYGTRFSVCVPLGDNSRSNDADNDVSQLLVQRSLLVIDDDSMVLEAMSALLSTAECTVYTAEDIDEALEIIHEIGEIPDMLIVDYRLRKGKTGVDAVNSVRQATARDIPAIIITGDTATRHVRDANNIALHILNKPIDSDKLINTISEVLERQASAL